MSKKITIAIIVGFILIAGAFFYTGDKTNREATPVLAGADMTVYKTATCGCCGNYADYASRRGLNVNTEVVSDQEMSAVKAEHQIPEDMLSCHTSMIEGYVVEGHIPLEVIEKLVTERPEIRGIAMPGMPSGSPGMPGAKTGPFEIYALNNDGSTELFISL